MQEIQMAFPIELITILLLIAAAVAMSVKWIKVPYSIALVVVGLMIGLFHLLPTIHMTPALILVVFLPALLFEASWNTHLRRLQENWLSISVFSTIGVMVSLLIIASIMHFWGNLSLLNALLFGAIVSATDPISVLSIFRKLGINKRLSTIIEGESLFNDGAAVTLFQLILFVAVTGSSCSIPIIIGKFFVVTAGGIAIGLAIGFGASKIISFFDDHLLELMLTTLVAYGALFIGQQFGVSPVMAIVTAGIVLGSYGSKVSMTASTRIAIDTFWEYAAFVVNSLVFLLIGLQINLALLAKYSHLIAIGILALIVSRIVIAYGLSQFVSTKKLPIPLPWRHILFWGAIRGSLSMALALSLPIDFPRREELIVLTFGVVLYTLLVQGLSLEPLVKLYRHNKNALLEH